ncbi:response regulator transcription factor [Anaeropeptidivorans aminofermentans]|jgi:DNA-binding response OmpR family regulator|uniref:response regulator transcription factor n=1 Tax=Anaeropeptidivorans aminofermentans TaxID=2934315 RepID=UPI002024608C|nr:response regulator transcription factor [Anaeropeptidivorans aminofermentans]MBE6013515.1 response regulator transcription factor [Lachnospiraceae bacterium]
MNEYNILVADDDKEIRNALDIYLTNEGMNVFLAADGAEALEILEKTDVHLIIMDIMMPKMDGIQATLKIRQDKDIPIIILSAKSEDRDVILGLNIGADDYMTKPFNFLELIARVKSNLRRYTKYENYQKNKEDDGVLSIRGLVLNKKTNEVFVNGTQVHLTPIEFKILQLLMENKNITFSIEEIYEKVWKEPFYNSENTVAVHIRRIREKIEVNPKEPMYLKVVWGVGYKIEK